MVRHDGYGILKKQWLSKSCGPENRDRAAGYGRQHPDFFELCSSPACPATELGSLRSRFDQPFSSAVGSARGGSRETYDQNFPKIVSWPTGRM
jgi:hypothetical protein